MDAAKVTRVLFCTGKVYYDLREGREASKREDVAIIRLEQLYPVREEEIQAALAPYAEDAELVWVQEEPFNSGPWYYVNAHWPTWIGGSRPITCVSRAASASPATGSKHAHAIEQERLVQKALGGDA